MANLGEIMSRVMVRLSAMGGLDVQTYMQPKVAEMIRYRYDQLFVMRFWRDTVTTEEMTIDPTTGLVIADISSKIKRFIDIQYIIPDGSDRPLTEKRTNRSSKRNSMLQYEPHAQNNKVFRIIPPNGNIPSLYEVSYRTYQTEWLETSEIPFDDQLLILGTCSDYSVGEGANMEMATNFQNMYRERLREMQAVEMQHEKSLHGGESPGLYDWH